MKEAELSAEDFITVWNAVTGDTDVMIRIRRTPEFFDTTQEVSDYLKGLSLTAEENNHLVELMVKNVNAAVKSGFADGIRYGVVFTREFGNGQGTDQQEGTEEHEYNGQQENAERQEDTAH